MPAQNGSGLLLRGFKGGSRVRRIAAERRRIRRQRDCLKRALVDQRVDDAAGTGGGLGERGLGEGKAAFRCCEDTGAALVMRCGGGPARRTPTRAGSGPAFNGVPIAIRNTMPRGLKVQRATQSMNFRQLPESGGLRDGRRWISDLRVR